MKNIKIISLLAFLCIATLIHGSSDDNLKFEIDPRIQELNNRALEADLRLNKIKSRIKAVNNNIDTGLNIVSTTLVTSALIALTCYLWSEYSREQEESKKNSEETTDQNTTKDFEQN